MSMPVYFEAYGVAIAVWAVWLHEFLYIIQKCPSHSCGGNVYVQGNEGLAGNNCSEGITVSLHAMCGAVLIIYHRLHVYYIHVKSM